MTFDAKASNECDMTAAADKAFIMLQSNVAKPMEAGVFRPGNLSEVAEALWACMHEVFCCC